MSKPRCINLDWLEVHVMEPVNDPHDANYFRSAGLTVVERDYGTRVYKEMFTVNDPLGNPFVEVRRAPYSTGYSGIHDERESHLRLVNAACYYDDAAARLQQFMEAYHYEFNRISRVDICMDFERFDEGDDPAAFLSRYLRQVYSKINQGNITAHGADRWNGQVWNSVSWGSPTSAIGTKFYNKTMELYDAASGTYRKPHIRYAWLKCGLIDDFHKVLKQGLCKEVVRYRAEWRRQTLPIHPEHAGYVQSQREVAGALCIAPATLFPLQALRERATERPLS